MIKYIGKCLYVREEGEEIVVIGDMHLGIEESMNISGVYVGRVMFDEIIKDLKEVFEETGKVDKVIILGDLKHNFNKNLGQEWNDVKKIIVFLKEYCKEIIITKGNHDNYLKNIIKEIEVIDYYLWKEYCFMHGDKKFDEFYDKKIKIWVMGHGHPAIKISDRNKIEKYKCFLEGKWKDKKIILLPSFVYYNEGSDIRENDLKYFEEFNLKNFKVFVVSENLEVFNFGILNKINLA